VPLCNRRTGITRFPRNDGLDERRHVDPLGWPGARIAQDASQISRLTVLRDARRDRRERSTMQDPGSSIPTREFGIIFATACRKEKTMGKAGTLHDAFVDELRDTYDAEKQLTKALAKMAKAATSPDLQERLLKLISRKHADRSNASTRFCQPRREGTRQAL
jgi:Domain of unknown function (DUF892)